jgi:CheY-like chemotaxis protein
MKKLSPPCGGHFTILIVDDDDDNLLLIQEQLLELLNCDVVSAKDGQSAVSLANHWQPDLILLDIMMPGMDGCEVAQCLKQDPQTQAIPVVAVTAMARIQDEAMALQSGCNDYLRKPYELEHLADVLDRYLTPSLAH